jgi:hypothetical protein
MITQENWYDLWNTQTPFHAFIHIVFRRFQHEFIYHDTKHIWTRYSVFFPLGIEYDQTIVVQHIMSYCAHVLMRIKHTPQKWYVKIFPQSSNYEKICSFATQMYQILEKEYIQSIGETTTPLCYHILTYFLQLQKNPLYKKLFTYDFTQKSSDETNLSTSPKSVFSNSVKPLDIIGKPMYIRLQSPPKVKQIMV